LNVSVDLAQEAPAAALLVSESGLRSGDDLRRLQAVGYTGFLIGEALMGADDPAEALRALVRDAGDKEMVRVKVCGITNLKDALACVNEGADMLGFNFYRSSLRYIAPEEARRIIEQLPSGVMSVGIFVNEHSPERVASIADVAGGAAIQLHGEETPLYCQALKNRFVIKALRVQEGFMPEHISEYQTEAILLDAFNSKARGGTGERFDWSVAQQTRPFVSKLFLAGGLTPENVSEAIAAVRPYAVDVCSSVESVPGQKDEKRVRAFIAAAKGSAKETAAVSE
jgi:phosphoribosylanthranilate isomerase